MFSKQNILYLLRVFCRYFIAYQMFTYAFAKILKSQFDLGLSSTIDESITSFNGFMLTWYYYGYSRTYGLIIASTQIISALLLLFRKTERVGVVLFLSFMINILLVNYFYEIDGAKPMSVSLTIMGVFLLLSDWSAFKNYFFKANLKENLVPKTIPEKVKKLYWLKFLIIPLIVFFAYKFIADIKKDFLVKNELFGVWEITRKNTKNKIDKLYFDYDNRIKVRDTLDNMYYGNLELNSEKKVVKIEVKHYSDRANSFIQDSIEKMNIPEKDIKKIRSNIREFYNTRNNTLPINLSFKYELKSDSLVLIGKTKDKYLNITDNYIN